MKWLNRLRIRLALRKVDRVPLAIRQMRNAMNAAVSSHFGGVPMSAPTRKWEPPVPRRAQHALWEDLHTFVPGGRPRRDPYVGLHGSEPPMSLRCPICECEQSPMHVAGERRRCCYCGLTLQAFGTRIFWWRDPVKPAVEWRG